MSKQVTEAEMAITLANTFGRKPPKWAVEARRQELHEAGRPTMSYAEANSVKIAEVFGRVPDRSRLVEAERILANDRPDDSGSANAGDLQGRMTTLIGEVASEAQRILGMSPERAKLEAQSQAMLCRETTKSVASAVAALEKHRDAMRKSPGVRR